MVAARGEPAGRVRPTSGMGSDLLRRVRWRNVARAAVGGGRRGRAVVAWPRLTPPAPRLPGPAARPLVEPAAPRAWRLAPVVEGAADAPTASGRRGATQAGAAWRREPRRGRRAGDRAAPPPGPCGGRAGARACRARTRQRVGIRREARVRLRGAAEGRRRGAGRVWRRAVSGGRRPTRRPARRCVSAERAVVQPSWRAREESTWRAPQPSRERDRTAAAPRHGPQFDSAR